MNTLVAALAASTCMAAVATPAYAQQREFNIPAGSLQSALDAYGRQSNRPIIYKTEEVRGIRSPGYRGTGSTDQALNAILANTGFVVRPGESGSVAIIRSGGGQSSSDSGALSGQEAGKDVGEAIIVTGYRASIEQSLRQKRDANAVLEVITAEDIGKFPDKNVADALQRVPGVFITRDGGEGSRVSIRGLKPELVLTELNGNYVASADTNQQPSRSFNYVLLPSNMISKVEVFKSAEARIDEGGVGGTVILHTRRPIDLDAWSGFIQVEGTYGDTTKQIDPQISGMLSWKNKDETFGLLVGATWQKRNARTMEATTEDWRWWTDNANVKPPVDVNGNPIPNFTAATNPGKTTRSGRHYSGYWAPTAVDFGIRDENRERLGIQATAEYRPTDNLTLTANYFRFKLKGDQTVSQNKLLEGNYDALGGSYDGDPAHGYGSGFKGAVLDSSGTIFRRVDFMQEATCPTDVWRCALLAPQISGTYSREKALSQTGDLTLEYTSDKFDARVVAGRTWANGGPSIRFRTSVYPTFGSAVGSNDHNGNHLAIYDFTGDTPRLELSPNIQGRINAGVHEIDIGSTDSTFELSKTEQVYFQADFTQRVENGWLDSIQFGAKYRDGSVRGSRGHNYWYCPGTETKYQDCEREAERKKGPDGYLKSSGLDNIPGGFKTNAFPAIDLPVYLNYLNTRYGDSVRVVDPLDVYDVKERIWAGYLQANFKTDRIRGNIGLRVVHTNQSTTSTDIIQHRNDAYVDGPAGPLGTPLVCPASGQASYQGTAFPCEPGDTEISIPTSLAWPITHVLTSQEKSFTDFLPSLNVAYEINPDLILRGAVAKVIARPNYTDLGARQSLNYVSPALVHDLSRSTSIREGWSGSGGNKDLAPYSAWQYDLGLEWYFHPGSVVGLGLFRKDVKNFVVPLVIDQPRVLDGQETVVRAFSTSANGTSAVSQGVEFYAQHTLDFGLGFQANFTYNDTSTSDVTLDGKVVGKSPLVGSAKTQINASVFYETDKLLLRASYNRRGTIVGGLQSSLNVYSEPYAQIDLNASYNIFKNFILSASVINLTKSEERAHLGNDTKDRFVSNVYSGRRAYLGLTYKF